jgi:fluoroacetyl-CoA thioesterase
MVNAGTSGPLRGIERPVAVTLTPGLERALEFEAAGALLTDVGGTIGVRVLSTPGMIAMMERTCAMLSLANLPEGRATVGFEVCVKHVAGAVEGTPCVCRARLVEIIDGRKLRFEVRVSATGASPAAERTIGLGTHERRVIDVAAHAAAASARAGAL